MKKLILLILLLPSVVFAHDVDKEQEREKPGDMHNAAEHLKAALTGRAIFQGHVQACENYRQFLESYTYYLLGAK